MYWKNRYLPSVTLLLPEPCMGSTNTLPDILQSPTKASLSVLNITSCFVAKSLPKPLKVKKNQTKFSENQKKNNYTHFVFNNVAVLSPIPTLLVNNKSMLTGLSLPCLMCNFLTGMGSMALKFRLSSPGSTKKNRKWLWKNQYLLRTYYARSSGKDQDNNLV